MTLLFILSQKIIRDHAQLLSSSANSELRRSENNSSAKSSTNATDTFPSPTSWTPFKQTLPSISEFESPSSRVSVPR